MTQAITVRVLAEAIETNVDGLGRWRVNAADFAELLADIMELDDNPNDGPTERVQFLAACGTHEMPS